VIFGIGVDVLDSARVARTLERFGARFIEHLLMPEEHAQLARTARRERFIAMRFAAKEAIVKAMGTGFGHGVWIRDVGVVQNAWGKPEVVFSERGERAAGVADRCGARDALGRARARGRGRGAHEGAVNTLVFDIETVPDVALGRRLYDLDGLADEQVARAMLALRRQASGGDFLPLEQHRVVAISCALRSREGLRVWSLGDPGASEGELVQRFFEGIDRFSPDLVSWNGAAFDLPVLTYRALLAGVQAARYWETGEKDQAFRYNNYLSRYHWRHTDLMDVLSGYQSRGRVSLANMACLLGLPGKLGLRGSEVWEAWQSGNLAGIRHYCEADVLNTWLVYLRFAQLRGRLTRAQHAEEIERVRALLRASPEPHFAQFLRAWTGQAVE